MSLVKARLLLEQAKKDLEIGCFDKAVSAAYFSVRMAAELLTQSRARRDDKLANALGNLMGDEVKARMMALYELRKRADYRGKLTSEGEAKLAVREAEHLLNSILEEMGKGEG